METERQQKKKYFRNREKIGTDRKQEKKESRNRKKEK